MKLGYPILQETHLKKLIIGIFASLILLAGCGVEEAPAPTVEIQEPVVAVSNVDNVSPLEGQIETEFAGLLFSGPASRLHVNQGTDTVIVSIIGEQDGPEPFAVMARLILRNLNREILIQEPRFSSDVLLVEGSLSVDNALGCSGPEAFRWDVDRGSSTTEVSVTQLDQNRFRFDFSLDFDNVPEDFMTGSFVLEVF